VIPAGLFRQIPVDPSEYPQAAVLTPALSGGAPLGYRIALRAIFCLMPLPFLR